jgi:hypothetical protein
MQYRGVLSSDADGIFALLEEVAPEIPVRLNTPEARATMFRRVVQCCRSEGSCVGVDSAGRIVGFLLAEPDEMERFHHDNRALHLPYGGVAKARACLRVCPCRFATENVVRSMVREISRRQRAT